MVIFIDENYISKTTLVLYKLNEALGNEIEYINPKGSILEFVYGKNLFYKQDAYRSLEQSKLNKECIQVERDENVEKFIKEHNITEQEIAYSCINSIINRFGFRNKFNPIVVISGINNNVIDLIKKEIQYESILLSNKNDNTNVNLDTFLNSEITPFYLKSILNSDAISVIKDDETGLFEIDPNYKDKIEEAIVSVSNTRRIIDQDVKELYKAIESEKEEFKDDNSYYYHKTIDNSNEEQIPDSELPEQLENYQEENSQDIELRPRIRGTENLEMHNQENEIFILGENRNAFFENIAA